MATWVVRKPVAMPRPTRMAVSTRPAMPQSRYLGSLSLMPRFSRNEFIEQPYSCGGLESGRYQTTEVPCIFYLTNLFCQEPLELRSVPLPAYFCRYLAQSLPYLKTLRP